MGRDPTNLVLMVLVLELIGQMLGLSVPASPSRRSALRLGQLGPHALGNAAGIDDCQPDANGIQMQHGYHLFPTYRGIRSRAELVRKSNGRKLLVCGPCRPGFCARTPNLVVRLDEKPAVRNRDVRSDRRTPFSSSPTGRPPEGDRTPTPGSRTRQAASRLPSSGFPRPGRPGPAPPRPAR